MIQENISQIKEYVFQNRNLRPDLLFTVGNNSSSEELNKISFLSDIEVRKFERPGVDKSTKGILIFDYSKNFGVRTSYLSIDNDLERAKAETITTELFLRTEHFWDFRGLISRQNGLQIIFSNSNPLDFLPRSYPDSEDK